MAAAEAPHVASRAVDDLYRQHRAEVYRYAYAVLGNHADAEDITQTTFLNAYRALEQGVRRGSLSNWLLTIASNAIKQRFRQEQARPRQVELDERIASSESDDEGPSVGELLTALSKIPPEQRRRSCFASSRAARMVRSRRSSARQRPLSRPCSSEPAGRSPGSSSNS